MFAKFSASVAAFLASLGIYPVEMPDHDQYLSCEMYLTTAPPSDSVEQKIVSFLSKMYNLAEVRVNVLTIVASADQDVQIVRVHVTPSNQPGAVPASFFMQVEKAHSANPIMGIIPEEEVNHRLINQGLAHQIPAGQFVAVDTFDGKTEYIVEVSYPLISGGSVEISVWDRVKKQELTRTSFQAHHLHADKNNIWTGRRFEDGQSSAAAHWITPEFESSVDIERAESGWNFVINKSNTQTAQLTVNLHFTIPDNQTALVGRRDWPNERIVIFGPPGVGKGTQASALNRVYGLAHIGAGDLLRAAKNEDSDLGREIKGYMDANVFVPDEIIVKLITAEILKLGRRGFILDGFPRTVSQAEKLETLLAQMGIPLTQAIFLEAPDSVLLERVLQRRRADDTEEILAQRLQDYRTKTAPLAEYYRAKNLLVEIDGTGTEVDVFKKALHQ